VFKQFLDILVVSSFPLGLPPEVEGLDLREIVAMDIFEVESICSVGGDILEVAVDVVFGGASVDQVVAVF